METEGRSHRPSPLLRIQANQATEGCWWSLPASSGGPEKGHGGARTLGEDGHLKDCAWVEERGVLNPAPPRPASTHSYILRGGGRAGKTLSTISTHLCEEPRRVKYSTTALNYVTTIITCQY